MKPIHDNLPLQCGAALTVLLVASACSVGDPAPRTVDEATAPLSEEPAGADQGHPPPGPKPCEEQGDCAEGCPPDSQGCSCHETPHGAKLCLPTCAADADCPVLPAGAPELVCREGICAPEHPPPRPPAGPPPKLCEEQDDCVDACPPDSQGCSCHQLPHGPKRCIPTCTEPADCPTPPGAPPMSCREGTCAPPGPPPPPPPAR